MKKLNIVGKNEDVSDELDRHGEFRHQVVSMLYDIIEDIISNFYKENIKESIKVIEKVTGKPVNTIIKIWREVDKKWGDTVYTTNLGNFVAYLRKAGIILNKKYEDLVEDNYYGE